MASRPRRQSRTPVAGRGRPSRARTPFIGREAELARLVARLTTASIRMVTITGRGGAGKSRLALEAAERLAPCWAGGVRHVELGSLSDLALVVGRVAAALDLRLAAGQQPEEALRRSLRYEPVLLVVDDLDRVPGAGAFLLNIYRKLGVRGRAEATAWAHRNGIVGGDDAPVSRLRAQV